MSTHRSVGKAHPHESAHLHVSGEAVYVDDMPEITGTLHAAIGISHEAHARIKSMDLGPVLAYPGVVSVLTAANIPGENNCGPIVHDDPIFARDVVEYAGQSIFAVIAESVTVAREAALLAKIEYEPLDAIMDIETALDRESFVMPTRTLRRGNPDAKIRDAKHRIDGAFEIGGQDHFYLEGQIAMAVPGEDGTMLVYSSTQHPSEVQKLVKASLGIQAKDVVVKCRRMGGGFGGKETQPALMACIAALAAARIGKPVKLRMDRDADMLVTGKRHPFRVAYDVGFDDDGVITGASLQLSANCGRSTDLSDAINARAIFHADNCYYIGDVEIISHRCKTNQPSHTAFRGFGGPQGMMVIECVMDEIARYLEIDALDVRKSNFYGKDQRNVAPYGMVVEDNIINEIVDDLVASSNYQKRKREVDAFNRESPILKRGIALTPVKFGISFTTTFLNQAGALIHVYTDGSILINHGGTEMGQGLHTKVMQIVAEEFQVDMETIRCSATNTSKVPNTSATAASAASDLNGKAAQLAARAIRDRLIAFAAEQFKVPEADIGFENNRVVIGKETVLFRELVMQAYLARVSLSATGYYKTPKINYDADTLTGRPFFYFCYGAAVSEVVIDTLTGENKLLEVDILHDVGKSLNPAIDMGQVEGGFLQGVGWLTQEELIWDNRGHLATHAPSTYKIPTAYDWPAKFRVDLLTTGRNREDNIYRSKAVGEPPLMLAMSVFHAIRNAIAAVNGSQPFVLDAPATPENILRAIDDLNSNRPARASKQASGS